MGLNLGIPDINGRLDRLEYDVKQVINSLDLLQRTLEETNKILSDLLQVQLITAGSVDSSEEV